MKTQILKATLLAFIIFFSCHQVSQQHPILEQAEKVMSEHPDSALFLLEQVATPEKMPERDYATWCLLITEARDKNYIEHTSDSLINVAIQYFEKKKDIKYEQRTITLDRRRDRTSQGTHHLSGKERIRGADGKQRP
jgi:hypothetical protein